LPTERCSTIGCMPDCRWTRGFDCRATVTLRSTVRTHPGAYRRRLAGDFSRGASPDYSGSQEGRRERRIIRSPRRTGSSAGAAGRRWKALEGLGWKTPPDRPERIHELPAAFTANSGGQGYAAPYTHTFQSDGSRNHPPIRQLSCRPVCCPVHRAKLKHACLKPMQAASAPISSSLHLVGVFTPTPGSRKGRRGRSTRYVISCYVL
jgi:hypothetical protein